jgi:GH15 family glucan-1,4-alpha-glucosidase
MTNPDANSERYHPIENYGVIGDLETVALVGMHGSIDFMCFPRFDSPTIFAALLDADKGGSFDLGPVLNGSIKKQLYLPDSNVLLTRFLSDDGVAEISDFMHLSEKGADGVLVRRVKTVHGEIRYKMRCAPRFDYARRPHNLLVDRDGYRAYFDCIDSSQPDIYLHSSIKMKASGGDATAEFVLAAGETATFLMEMARPEAQSPTSSPHYAVNAFKDTLNYWRNWLSKSSYKGRWREVVNRSALVLKLLTSSRFGSIVASPTFGLPEQIGGVRNWDYRYTWIRDSSFTLYALMRLGYTDEAHAFMHWLEKRIEESDTHYGGLQLMYGIDGRHQLTEINLDHLEGYKNSKPVRIGNGAYSQTQLDIYGELMDSVYLYDRSGGSINYGMWKDITRILDWLVDNWHLPDHGIWEIRGGEREFLFTRVMNWVALDRGIRLARKRSLPAPVEKWKGARDAIYQDIFDNFWNDELQSFVQSKGSNVMDASCLVMPLVRFIGPQDPKWLSTMRAVEEHLLSDSMVYRYLPPGEKKHNEMHINPLDGITGTEGTFSMCSFWYVECLSRSGNLQQARFLFEKMLGYANHLGLFGEELGLKGEHLGNFPQAFTHLALISAAYDLDRRLDEAGV